MSVSSLSSMTFISQRSQTVGVGYTILEQELRVHACIRVHTGQTKIWNQAGVRPEVCDVLERIAKATVWNGIKGSRFWDRQWAPSVRGQTAGEDVSQAPGLV